MVSVEKKFLNEKPTKNQQQQKKTMKKQKYNKIGWKTGQQDLVHYYCS